MIYAFMRFLMRTITRSFLVGIFTMVGRELVPRTGGLLVAGNHSSTADPPLVPAFLPRSDTWSMAKSEFFARPGFKRNMFVWYHSFPVVRHTPDRKAIRHALGLIKAGHALVIYPEGTRVADGLLKRPEPGAGFIALNSDAVIQPVGMSGTSGCFPKGRLLPRRVPVTLRFGSPFRLSRKRSDGSRTDHQDAADAIMVKIAELVPAKQRGDFSDLEAWQAKLEDVYLPAE